MAFNSKEMKRSDSAVNLNDSSLGDLNIENSNSSFKEKQISLKEEKEMLEKKEKAMKSMKKLLNLSERYSAYCKQKIENRKSTDSNKLWKTKATSGDEMQLTYFNGTLWSYQEEGVAWLKMLFENAVNGILADEMGLGKTIQVIAFLCHLIKKEVCGPFLIVVPLSTLSNWASELKKFAPKIPVVIFHGDRERLIARDLTKRFLVDDQYVMPVVLTTCQLIRNKLSVLNGIEWKYIIIDEAHCIKNHESKISQAVRSLNCLNKLLLTGTPLQNNLTELWALLNFIMPKIFNNIETFSSLFILKNFEDKNKIVEEEQSTNIISTIHKVLAPFMLRRLKCDVLTDNVPKKDILLYCPLSKLQRTLYTDTLRKNLDALSGKCDQSDTLDLNAPPPKRKCTSNVKYWKREQLQTEEDILGEKIDEETEIIINTVTMQSLVSMFKKIVDHPYLIRCPATSDKKNIVIDERLVNESGKMLVLDAMLPKLKARKHKILLFSTLVMMLDLLEEYLIMRGYTYCRLDGQMASAQREQNVAEFNNNPDIFIFLISTKAGGLGLNLIGADTVIFYDRDWNPQNDIQAQDRCHRIGQTKPVMIYSLITKNTIDEKIVNCGTAKRRLEKVVIKNGKHTDLHELEKMLENNVSQIHANGFLFTDQELESLLDRQELYDEMRNRGLQ